MAHKCAFTALTNIYNNTAKADISEDMLAKRNLLWHDWSEGALLLLKNTLQSEKLRGLAIYS